jgi:23S rRNA maturation mini-RNase III
MEEQIAAAVEAALAKAKAKSKAKAKAKNANVASTRNAPSLIAKLGFLFF